MSDPDDLWRGRESRWHRRPREPHTISGHPSMLGYVGSRCILPNRFLSVNPVILFGEEAEGGAPIRVVDLSYSVPIAALGNPPAAGDDILVTNYNYGWVGTRSGRTEFVFPECGPCAVKAKPYRFSLTYETNSGVDNTVVADMMYYPAGYCAVAYPEYVYGTEVPAGGWFITGNPCEQCGSDPVTGASVGPPFFSIYTVPLPDYRSTPPSGQPVAGWGCFASDTNNHAFQLTCDQYGPKVDHLWPIVAAFGPPGHQQIVVCSTTYGGPISGSLNCCPLYAEWSGPTSISRAYSAYYAGVYDKSAVLIEA